MNTKLVFLALAVSALAIAATSVLNTATPAFADKSSGDQGVDQADESIHENAPSDTDPKFHEGTCSGGFNAGGFEC